MTNSIRTVVSLTTNMIELLDNILNELKNKTTYQVNRSKIIRVAILYLSTYEELELKKLLMDSKAISKWQTDQSSIQEVNITLNRKCYSLLELMSNVDTDYKLYKSGLMRLAIIKLSEEQNLVDIFLTFVKES